MISKRIAIIVPYFGKLPDYFQFWLNSCKENTDIDWLIYTDDYTSFDYPKNVKVMYLTFEELKNKVKSTFEFEIELSTPYKICDYRVAYGLIFEEELAGYDFWGYCDIDIIFGKVSDFINDSILDDYDKILTRGHFTLYRNTKYMNNLFKDETGHMYYKEVFKNPNNCTFDECSKKGINEIFSRNKVKVFDEIVFADVYWGRYNFYLYQTMKDKKNEKNNIFQWNNGKLLRIFNSEAGLTKEPLMYVHLQKRVMTVETNSNNLFYIIPNKFIKIDDEISNSLLKRLTKHKYIYPQYIKIRYTNLVKKIKRTVICEN